MSIRCKMTCTDVVNTAYGSRKVFFSCTYDKTLAEDVSFSKATPSGHAEFMIDNPRATAQLRIGATYYVDFSPVDAATED